MALTVVSPSLHTTVHYRA